MDEIEKAILLLVGAGYVVGRLSAPASPPRRLIAPETEIEEAVFGKENYTVNEFCMMHGIGRTFFYDMLKRGRGPAIIKLGRKTLVPRDSAEAWASAQGNSA